MFILYLLLFFLLAFLPSYFIIKLLIKKPLTSRVSAEDIHKRNRVIVCSHGGIILSLTLFPLLPMLFNLFSFPSKMYFLLVTVSCSLFIGILDDFIGLSKLLKVSLGFVVFFPFLCLMEHFQLNFFFFHCESRLLWFIVYLFTCVFILNSVNMLAGFNGLEAGLSFIIISSLAFNAFARSFFDAALACAFFLGLLAGFLRFNWFPSKVFPGNSGTFLFGGFIAAILAYTNSFFPCILLFTPHLVDFILKLRVGLETRKMEGARISNENVLVPPSYVSFSSIVMKVFKPSEEKLVIIMLLIEFFFFLLSIALV